MNKQDRKEADSAIGNAQSIGGELVSIVDELRTIVAVAREDNGDADTDDTPLSAKQREEAMALIKKAVAHADALDAEAERMKTLGEAEQEKYDNLNEGLQASERGQAFESNAGNLESAGDEIEEAATTLRDADVSEDTTLDASKLDEVTDSISEAADALEAVSFDAE